jgi:hypothetical protein
MVRRVLISIIVQLHWRYRIEVGIMVGLMKMSQGCDGNSWEKISIKLHFKTSKSVIIITPKCFE